MARSKHLEAILIERAAGTDNVTHGLALASLHRAAVSEARQRGSHFDFLFVAGSFSNRLMRPI
jgi:hypothetical protein